METKEIALSRLVENKENPRTITTEKFQKLVKSLLVFPRMLTLRPIVVDETMTVLGGNMRLKALKHCVTMDEDSIRDILKEDGRFTKGEISNLMKYWMGWRKNPTATIVDATDLTEEQKKEFIIKDNVGFGDWDTNELANKWDTDQLKDWGISEWQLTGFTAETTEQDGNGLPDELQGKDLEPDDLPDLQGDDVTENERIIIVYKKDDAEYLAALLGLDKLDKVVYNVAELKDGD